MQQAYATLIYISRQRLLQNSMVMYTMYVFFLIAMHSFINYELLFTISGWRCTLIINSFSTTKQAIIIIKNPQFFSLRPDNFVIDVISRLLMGATERHWSVYMQALCHSFLYSIFKRCQHCHYTDTRYKSSVL